MRRGVAVGAREVPAGQKRDPHTLCFAPHLPSVRFMPGSAAHRGSADPLPARRRFCFRRQSASSAAAAEPEEDEPEAAQRSCSKVTGSVRFLIPWPTGPADHGARWPRSPFPRRSRYSSQPLPPGAGIPPPLTSHPQAAAPATDQLLEGRGRLAAPANQRQV